MKFKWFQAYVRTAQKVLLMVLLWGAYFLGLGLTKLFILIFNQEFLSEKPEKNGSFWVDAKGYGRDDHDVLRQS